MMRRRTATQSLLLAGILAGCSTPKPKVTGTQIAVLQVYTGMDVSPAAPPVTLAPATARPNWTQPLANPAHAPGNVAVPLGFKKLWQVQAGAPGGYRQPLMASPLVAGDNVFVLDANAVVHAFALRDGSHLWQFNTRPKHATEQNLGGGIAWDAGTLYVSTGFAEVLALDALGKVIWRQPLDLPARSAPLVANGLVAVVTLDDQLLTFNAASGTPGWRFSGAPGAPGTTAAGVSGAPAYSDGIVVAGFSNGTIAAVDANSGIPLWEQSLAAGSGQTSALDFADIVASPVIAGGVAYGINLSGTYMAVDLHSGVKVWTKGIGGTQPPALSNGFIFTVDNNQTLSAMHADDGLVSWNLQLPAYRNPKKQKQPIHWAGPLLVNGTLVLANDYAEVALVDAITGALQTDPKHPPKLAGLADMAPIAAGGVLLALTRDAKLTAYG